MKKTNPIKTVLTICIGLLFIYLFTKIKGWLYASILIGTLSLFSSYITSKIDFLWMKLTWLLSKVVPNILLVIIFYIILFPIALLSRVFGKKDELKLKNNGDSFFETVSRNFESSSFKKTW
jgi:hypothetical protein